MPLLPWGSGSSLLVTTDEIFSEKSSDLSLSVSAVHCSGGYCTGDNYRDERPIDVFVLNTSNYRWTEVV